MNPYTKTTKIWLEERFKETTESNIYFAHQPIYGFRDPNSEKYVINRYIITYQIMKALSHIKFDSLLDVGGAEGYKAAGTIIKIDDSLSNRNLKHDGFIFTLIKKRECYSEAELKKVSCDSVISFKVPHYKLI
ncbi:MAG: hypothetical protein AB1432_09620 [Bacteroidota bacterium]